jgi:hypothetical protein
MKHFISISQIDYDSLPIKVGKSTIYRWQSRYPDMFKKVGGKVFVDMVRLTNLLTNGE